MVLGGGTPPPRKVLVVADPNRKFAGALQYAFSHVVVENDTFILLHVENPNTNTWKIIPFKEMIFRRPSTNASTTTTLNLASSSAETAIGSENGGGGTTEAGGGGGEGIDFIEAMKYACGLANDMVKVQVEKVGMEGKDKASVILARCAALDVEVIIVGQKTNFSDAILGAKRSRSLRGMDTAEYLIESNKCTCVGVQRKATGGFILNSKTHKHFWLLA